MAKAAGAYHRCVTSNNSEWIDKWHTSITEWTKEHFPRGSGFDSGTKCIVDESSDDLLVFETAFHHMNDGGMYDGWTEHRVKVKPSLGLGFRLVIGGPDRNQIKEYIAECFSSALETEIERETVTT